jgi:hypothetical protein
VGFFEIFTRISDILPDPTAGPKDPTADARKPPIIMMPTKTITCAAPKSLTVFISVFILSSFLTIPRSVKTCAYRIAARWY